MSDDSAYRSLLARYAGERHLCQCQLAYRGPTGTCPGGCARNRDSSRNWLDEQILEEKQKKRAREVADMMLGIERLPPGITIGISGGHDFHIPDFEFQDFAPLPVRQTASGNNDRDQRMVEEMIEAKLVVAIFGHD